MAELRLVLLEGKIRALGGLKQLRYQLSAHVPPMDSLISRLDPAKWRVKISKLARINRELDTARNPSSSSFEENPSRPSNFESSKSGRVTKRGSKTTN